MAKKFDFEPLRDALLRFARRAGDGISANHRRNRRKVDDDAQAIRDRDREMGNDVPSDRDYVRGDGPAQPVGPDGRPSQYTVYHEMTLDQRDWARSRDVHFNRANRDLDEAMQGDADFAAWLERVSPGIGERVTSAGGRSNPDPADFIWHHAHPDTVDGRYGVMQLVPSFQHTPGSEWWRVLHPGSNGGGGYAIWGGR